MLPSLLIKDIQQGLKQHLLSSQEPSDDFFNGILSRFVEDESSWQRGPFLQLGLPFQAGKSGRSFFSDFETEKPGYQHQEAAWLGLSSQHQATNTLVATGTGSGKTECFLYPILDHVARAKRNKEAGIKALIIYPMNALATDQARRLAELIHSTPAFEGLRVGLFVGGNAGEPGSGLTMTADSVITDRNSLRKAPPDILLTNYKMLDYLLIRPKDRDLWSKNTPETLRYIVVDELHTFDGAQGTDLALLIRRLRARLNAPEGHLICAGTSATLGGSSDSSPLREYARQIFGEDFPPDSVITENRLSVSDFLGDRVIDHVFEWRTEWEELLSPTSFSDQSAAIAAWFQIFFPDLDSPRDVLDPKWRQELGGNLKSHLLFVNLLRISKGGTLSYPEILEQLGRTLPEQAKTKSFDILNALLAMIAWARSPEASEMPLVTLRVQLWLRELRRMVAKVAVDPQEISLKSSADLKSKPDGIYLPLIQCTQCFTTAWLTRMPSSATKVSTALDEIYNQWFSGSSDIVRLYPAKLGARPQAEGIEQLFCAECGSLQASGSDCIGCGSQSLIKVYRTTGVATSTRGNVNYAWHDDSCPGCGERHRLILIGSRNATLGAQVIEQSWGSIFNDDKKLIAFSDSVQDAAHRAGFFNARTYIRTVRTALAKSIDQIVQQPIPWSHFLEKFPLVWEESNSPLYLRPESLVSEFIGPNMVWQNDWANELLQDKGLPRDSKLPSRTMSRLLWQVQSEMTYLSARGRTLERVGKAVLAPDASLVDAAVERLLPILAEKLDARNLEANVVFQWLYGFLIHLRQRGAVWHSDLLGYASDGNIWGFIKSRGRGEWLPPMGDRSPKPTFLTLGQHRYFDSITAIKGLTWYQKWLDATIGSEHQMALAGAPHFYREAVHALEESGLLRITEGTQGDTVSLNPDHLLIHTDTVSLSNDRKTRRLTIPRSIAPRLLGMPCMDDLAHTYVQEREFAKELIDRIGRSDLRRVISAEHTGLLERSAREHLEQRFKAKNPQPWYENLLSATPTLEMGVDIGSLSSVLLCSVPPNQASFLQRIGRAGRRDGNAVATILADGSSPHDLYFFESTQEMLSGEVLPPGIFLQAAEVLRRQMMAFCLDHWVASGIPDKALPEKTSAALDAIENFDTNRFPYLFLDHIENHEDALLQGFIDILGADITTPIEERLTSYYRGENETEGLRIRLLKALEELSTERAHYKSKVKQIKQKIKSLKSQPQDEVTKNEIDQLDRELQSALVIIRDINHRELLGTLTDAGLIPNYAFPEAGIELKSVLWRKKSSDDHTDRAYVALPAMTYERPAASALSEFAPENRFYANQRKVEVDQINMDLAKLENWRLCPSCHHMENLDQQPDQHSVCPRCRHVMWADITQKRQLLRFRQAIANSDDTQVRIDDSADDREPKFYVRQLLVDFEKKDIREAWKVSAASLPFGFEFISHATFRDVNFGEKGKTGNKFKVADNELERPGFKLCRYCGKVQSAHRSRRTEENKETSQLHAFDCDKRQSDDPGNLVDFLYLYREFHSEALRILVPYTKSGVDDEVIHSFIAALQYGLKAQYGGKVDHLRIVTQDEPGLNGGPRRNYVLLYDSVPGGTGYLHQLLSQDAQTLIDVISKAHDGLRSCGCNQDPDKDGCYRCVYQYRQGHAMEKVSRSKAVNVLGELREALKEIERVATVSDIYINPHFDSALEASFIESLKRIEAKNGKRQTRLVTEIVHGKSGYLLEVDKERYWIEPQVACLPSDGIAFASKPDFVVWPATSNSGKRAIAVFCDGWAYHKDQLDEDAKKRSALVASGRFWVWSVTYEDVKSALSGDDSSDLSDLMSYLPRTQSSSTIQVDKNFINGNAISQLIALLSLKKDQMDGYLLRNAAGFTAPLIHRNEATLDEALITYWNGLPHWMQTFPEKSAWASSRPEIEPKIFLRWAASLMNASQLNDLVPGVVLLDRALTSDEKALHLAWRYWLRIFNLIQVLPGTVIATRENVSSHDLDFFEPEKLKKKDGTSIDGISSVWDQCIEKALSALHDGMKLLADANLPPPDEVGYEWSAGGRDVTAEAELCWLEQRVVVLMEHQFDYEPVWSNEDWTVVLAHEGWPERLIELLKINE